jgi:hypothetical protein
MPRQVTDVHAARFHGEQAVSSSAFAFVGVHSRSRLPESRLGLADEAAGQFPKLGNFPA